MIKQAIELCYNYHKGQVDKAGKPYFLHPMTVALNCNNDDEKVVALLHDILEDTEITVEELIEKGIPERLCRSIVVITKKENDSYEKYVDRVAKDPIAIAVKIKDLEHNMDVSRLQDPTQKDYDRIEKYRKVHSKLLNYKTM